MKIGRNEPCPCGSGEKYKKCCMNKPENPEPENPEPENDDEDNYELFEPTEEDDLEYAELLVKLSATLHDFTLKYKSHIKKYKKLRDLHGDIINSMVEYFEDEKFDLKLEPVAASSPIRNSGLSFISYDFDLKNQMGIRAFYDIIIYKSMPNANCITEDYIKNHIYKNSAELNFLQSMLDSKLGLFRVTDVESKNAYIHLEEIFTGEKFKITDIGLSSGKNSPEIYIYTRIITYNEISFGTGLNILFDKDDPFIKEFIEKNKKIYSETGELYRFMQLYKRYVTDNNKIISVQNSF